MGSKIGSGAVIGAGSVVSNKTINSNTTYAGAPLKLIKDNSFWIPHSVHGWSEEDISKMSVYNSELFVYDVDDSTLNFDGIENDLNSFSELDDVVSYIWSTILVGGKNRFTIK